MRRIAAVAILACSIGALGFVAANATPAKDAESTVIARALMTTGGALEIETDKDTTVHDIILAPGGSSGWHSHPDGGVFLVVSGTLSNYGLDGPPCDPVEVPAGKAFFVPPMAHHPHLALNRGSEPLKLTIVYFNVPAGESARLDAEPPEECPPDLR